MRAWHGWSKIEVVLAEAPWQHWDAAPQQTRAGADGGGDAPALQVLVRLLSLQRVAIIGRMPLW
jgi:hypothetical protein